MQNHLLDYDAYDNQSHFIVLQVSCFSSIIDPKSGSMDNLSVQCTPGPLLLFRRNLSKYGMVRLERHL